MYWESYVTCTCLVESLMFEKELATYVVFSYHCMLNLIWDQRLLVVYNLQ